MTNDWILFESKKWIKSWLEKYVANYSNWKTIWWPANWNEKNIIGWIRIQDSFKLKIKNKKNREKQIVCSLFFCWFFLLIVSSDVLHIEVKLIFTIDRLVVSWVKECWANCWHNFVSVEFSESIEHASNTRLSLVSMYVILSVSIK